MGLDGDSSASVAASWTRWVVSITSSTARAARSLPHLLDPRYDDLLTREGQKETAKKLRDVLPTLETLAEQFDGWREIADRITSWGAHDGSGA